MLLKQSPGLGNKYKEFHSPILPKIPICMPRMMPGPGSPEMNKIIIMQGDQGGGRAAPGRDIITGIQAQRQHRGGDEELLGFVGRRKVS